MLGALLGVSDPDDLPPDPAEQADLKVAGLLWLAECLETLRRANKGGE